MKKALLLAIAVFVVISLVFGVLGCAKPAPVTTPTPTPVTTPTPVKMYKLRLNGIIAAVPGYPNYEWVRLWIDALKERSHGQIDIEYFPLNQLVPTQEALGALGKGIIDFQYASMVHFENKVPEGGVLALPFVANDYDGMVAKAYGGIFTILDEAYQKQGVKVVGFFPLFGSVIHTISKPVYKMEDLKGLLIRAAGGFNTKLVAALGAAPTYIEWSELPLAVERKTVDGLTADLASSTAVPTFLERIRYVVYPPLSPTSMTIFMNLRLYNEMSPELQKLVIDTAKEMTLGKAKDLALAYLKKAEDKAIKAGWQFNQLPADEFARWKQVGLGLWGEFPKAVPGAVGEKLLELAKK